MPEERLQKILAHAGIASRRKAEDLIVFGSRFSERRYGNRTWFQGGSIGRSGKGRRPDSQRAKNTLAITLSTSRRTLSRQSLTRKGVKL